MPSLEIEARLIAEGANYVAGVDEAGRGSLAGPVVAAAVILPNDSKLVPPGIDDSKKLTPRKREQLFFAIRQAAVSYAIGYSFRPEIDTDGILPASFNAMLRALNQLGRAVDYVLVDGNQTIPRYPLPQLSVVRGDSASLSIAASSILAKVARDHLMVQLAMHFPDYGFAKHKGYGTKAHRQVIAQLGRSAEHRTSFRIASHV